MKTFEQYPRHAQQYLAQIRELILTLAKQNNLGTVEETLKWGEISYLVKEGSSIRTDWKEKDPDYIKVYFHCQSKLIETFREIYPDEFEYEGKRAICIPLNAPINIKALSHCLLVALQYHSRNHKPLLGA